MPVFCAVYECLNRSNRENTRNFYHVRKCIAHKGKNQEIKWKMQEKVACKPASGVDRSRSDNSRVSVNMNNTFSYTIKVLCVFTFWPIWAFINSAKHRHLEFLLLIPMEKKSLPALQLHLGVIKITCLQTTIWYRSYLFCLSMKLQFHNKWITPTKKL